MGYSASQQALFSLLPKARNPWSEFAFSTGTQACLVALVLWLRVFPPAVLSSPEHTFRSIQLVSPPVPVNHELQPLRPLPKPLLTAELEAPSNALRLPAPSPKATKVKV